MSFVINVSDENFETEILNKSQETTVVVDFWAEWCAPCRTLGPLLENLAGEYQGKFILAKVDTEKAPVAASQFGIQSIPAVFAMRDEQVVDGFMGALPESQLREWLERVLPSRAETLFADAQKLRVAEPQQAEQKLRESIEIDSQYWPAQIELASLLVALNRHDDAREILSNLEKRGFLEPEAENVKAALEVKQQSQASGGIEICRQALAADPENLELQLNLGKALAAESLFEESMRTLLNVVQNSPLETRDEARQALVDVFRMADDAELVSEYRRKLSMALY